MGFVGDARGKQMLGTLITPTRMSSLSPVHSFRVSRRLTELNSSQLGFPRALLECNPGSEAWVRGKNREVGGDETPPVTFSTNFTIVLALSLYIVCLFCLCVFFVLLKLKRKLGVLTIKNPLIS